MGTAEHMLHPASALGTPQTAPYPEGKFLVFCDHSVSLFGSHPLVKPFMYLRSILFFICFLSHVQGVCCFSFPRVHFVFFHVPFRFHFALSLDAEKAVTQEVRSNLAWSISRAGKNANRAFLVAQRESVLPRLRRAAVLNPLRVLPSLFPSLL